MILFAAETKKVFLLGIIFFQSFFSFAQIAPDSIPSGVIKVKRPPIQAEFSVGIVYIYADGSVSQIHGTYITPNQTLYSDSVFNPFDPQPLNLELYHESRTTSGGAQAFDWMNYLSTLNYSFAWSDSTRSDSAQYSFDIDKKGKPVFKALPVRSGDSTAKVFENKTYAYASVLKAWQPGMHNKKVGSSKMKKVPCLVLVTIYAYDPNLNRTLPIENELPDH